MVDYTPLIGNIGEKSYKAHLSVAWKEVFQAPLVIERIRPKLVAEPRFAEVSVDSTQQFSAYGGGGRNKYSFGQNASGGSITSDGLYTPGSVVGAVDKIVVTDRFGMTAEAVVEVNA